MLGMERRGAATVALLLLGLLAGSSSGETWTIASLSQARGELAATAGNGKVFFAGGAMDWPGGHPSDVVDVYDSALRTWTIAHLSQGRDGLFAASAGGKVLFGGGIYYPEYSLEDNTCPVVDICDTAGMTWTIGSIAGRSDLSAVGLAGRVVFAGGRKPCSAGWILADIYDTSTSAWSMGRLSQARFDLAGAGSGSTILFAGGVDASTGQATQVVDTFDTGKNTWGTSTLSHPRYRLAGASWGTKLFFAGGLDSSGPSNVVDIYDTVGGTWTTSTLPSAAGASLAAAAEGMVFYAGGTDPNMVDVYDTFRDTWSTFMLPHPRTEFGMTAWGNQVFFAGGFDGSGNPSAVVDIYTMPEPTSLLLLGLGALAITPRRSHRK